MPRNTLMDPPIEELLDKVDSKFTLVALGASRARQVNAYYNSLGEGLGRVVPPQVTSVSGKPLSIAFEEIAEGKATYTRREPGENVEGEEGDTDAAGSEPSGFEPIAGLATVVDDVALDPIDDASTGDAGEPGDEDPAAG
jgi:DNA-directed RNA polymerase subunit omega